MSNQKNKEKIISKREFWRQQRLADKEKYKKCSRAYVRLTANEKAYLIKQATVNGYDLTTYLLESALYSEINVISLEFLKEHTLAINRLGNNINQITRQINIAIENEFICKDDINEFRSCLLQDINLVKELYELNQKIYIKLHKTLVQKKTSAYDENIDYINEEISNMDTCP